MSSFIVVVDAASRWAYEQALTPAPTEAERRFLLSHLREGRPSLGRIHLVVAT